MKDIRLEVQNTQEEVVERVLMFYLYRPHDMNEVRLVASDGVRELVLGIIDNNGLRLVSHENTPDIEPRQWLLTPGKKRLAVRDDKNNFFIVSCRDHLISDD